MTQIIQPDTLTPAQIEEIEKVSARFVFQSLKEFSIEAEEIFAHHPDEAKDVAEDVTREALGRHPGYPLGIRIFGVMDFKRATYCFMVDHVVKQALLVDSKAEQSCNVARLQTSQTSLPIRQMRAGIEINEPGGLDPVMTIAGQPLLVTTIFAHYCYRDRPEGGRDLRRITIAALPNGRLADVYVPSASNTIWVAGPNAPTRGEAFRTRLNFSRLRQKAPWRVQLLEFTPSGNVRGASGEWIE